jgi:hypothetical protein
VFVLMFDVSLLVTLFVSFSIYFLSYFSSCMVAFVT